MWFSDTIVAENALPRACARVVRRSYCLIAALSLAMMAGDGLAQFVPLYDGADGATCDYFNRGAWIRWRHRHGDWKDARDTEQGDVPFAEASVRPADNGRIVTWDVTTLVQGWLTGKYIIATGYGQVRARRWTFHSREAAAIETRPSLNVVLVDGTTRHLSPTADTTLDCSTVYGLGRRSTISAGTGRRLLMQFDLSKLQGVRVSKATLELTTTNKQFGDTTVDLFRLAPHLSNESLTKGPKPGWRESRATTDRARPDVIMATSFGALWQKDGISEIRGTLNE